MNGGVAGGETANDERSKMRDKTKKNSKLMKMLENDDKMSDSGKSSVVSSVSTITAVLGADATAIGRRNGVAKKKSGDKNGEETSKKSRIAGKKGGSDNGSRSQIGSDDDEVPDTDSDASSLKKSKKILKSKVIDDGIVIPSSSSSAATISTGTTNSTTYSSLRNGKKLPLAKQQQSLQEDNVIKKKDDTKKSDGSRKDKIVLNIHGSDKENSKSKDDLDDHDDESRKKKGSISRYVKRVTVFVKNMLYEDGKVSTKKLGMKLWPVLLFLLLMYILVIRRRHLHGQGIDKANVKNEAENGLVDNDELKQKGGKESGEDDLSALDLSQKLGPKKKKAIDKEMIKQQGCQELQCSKDCVNKGKPKCLKSKSCKDQRSKLCSHRCRKSRCEDYCKDVPKRGYVEQEQAMENCKEKCQKAGGGTAAHNKCIKHCHWEFKPCSKQCKELATRYPCDNVALLDDGNDKSSSKHDLSTSASLDDASDSSSNFDLSSANDDLTNTNSLSSFSFDDSSLSSGDSSSGGGDDDLL